MGENDNRQDIDNVDKINDLLVDGQNSSINRFSNKAENYSKYRPTYTLELIEYLYKDAGLVEGSVIADIGSGTGKFSERLLEKGSTVICVEPNKDMRLEAEKLLSHYKEFFSIDSSAEETTIEAESVDVITCATSFHWFDKAKCKIEFKRILKPNGKVAIVYNSIGKEGNEYWDEIETIIMNYDCSHDYVPLQKKNKEIDKMVQEFFDSSNFDKKFFENPMFSDFEEFKGSMLATAWSPKITDNNYNDFCKEIKALFDKYSIDGQLRIICQQTIYIGKL